MVRHRPLAGTRSAGRGRGDPCSVTRWLVAGKDLRIEARSRVGLNQVAPFAVLVLILFAFALDPDSGALDKATPGLFWVAVLFCGAAGHPAVVRGRGGRRQPRRAAPVRAGAGRDLPRQGAGRRRSSSWPSRSLLGLGVVLLYGSHATRLGPAARRPAWPRPPASRPPVRSMAFSPPVSGSGRRCCPCCCSRCWLRC